ncbi:MAG: hypothetical protein KJ850_06840 [Gammaproteobacteria bacterium]|nr:hypothetical protein [Gammaproteobacteria bacterium]MBU1624752.1 hypothetical protein [Gammaproteobacteria bacterium]MBU1982596.1 hypothetical protein [Gammaproteobacteria bacterium]
MNPFELHKERVLVFADEPDDQVEQAYLLLSGLKNFEVVRVPAHRSLRIRYSVVHYSLEGLQKALQKEGFVFNFSLLDRIKHTLIHYCEDVQYHNLKTPEPRTKNNSQEVFVKAYEQHPHGDHVDISPESSEAK